MGISKEGVLYFLARSVFPVLVACFFSLSSFLFRLKHHHEIILKV